MTNARTSVVELIPSTQCQGTLLSVESLDGAPAKFPSNQGTCASVMWGGPPYVLACDNADERFLWPGETTVLEWSGALAHEVTLPRACCRVEWECLKSCELIQTANHGRHRMTFAVVDRNEEDARHCEKEPSRCRPENYETAGFAALPHERVAFDVELPSDVVEIRIEGDGTPMKARRDRGGR